MSFVTESSELQSVTNEMLIDTWREPIRNVVGCGVSSCIDFSSTFQGWICLILLPFKAGYSV